MKRDMELVREILLAIEASGEEPRGWTKLSMPERDPVEVSYHVKLLHEAGLLHGINLSSSSGFCWAPKSLTWAGHEFLDAARNDTVWNRAMTILREKAATVPFEILKAVIIQQSKAFFGVE
ncbi:DUF2513 domain-containing protein [Planctellipticum variicoloris]|uniref:DUF2513 domain-containing protein n=1 Tax=Planctellipticum variicoloris TaxID=3064265 RepID=UPI0030137456|nr:DUF2513 domain-containing protein [Planctomycetaceae bacterium SH412]